MPRGTGCAVTTPVVVAADHAITTPVVSARVDAGGFCLEVFATATAAAAVTFTVAQQHP